MSDISFSAPFEAYLGKDAYIFISYAHVDGSVVYPELIQFHKLGFRIWYDEGIEPGNEWPEEVAKALEGAAYFIVFISPASVSSRNVRNEINYALNNNKPLLAIHIEETLLPRGLGLQMGSIQAILKYNMPNTAFIRKIEKTLPKSLLFEIKSPDKLSYIGLGYATQINSQNLTTKDEAKQWIEETGLTNDSNNKPYTKKKNLNIFQNIFQKTKLKAGEVKKADNQPGDTSISAKVNTNTCPNEKVEFFKLTQSKPITKETDQLISKSSIVPSLKIKTLQPVSFTNMNTVAKSLEETDIPHAPGIGVIKLINKVSISDQSEINLTKPCIGIINILSTPIDNMITKQPYIGPIHIVVN
jgi:hypothetical protein